ncbi:hypothetical protein PIB30_093343, partial [Stylosanthes scabra]|nr:hypothetical protein [Stylosanthes scabra]
VLPTIVKLYASNEFEPSTSSTAFQVESHKDVVVHMDDLECKTSDKGNFLDLEALDQMMSEIGNMHASLRLMLDFQRREIAAKLAMKSYLNWARAN